MRYDGIIDFQHQALALVLASHLLLGLLHTLKVQRVFNRNSDLLGHQLQKIELRLSVVMSFHVSDAHRTKPSAHCCERDDA